MFFVLAFVDSENCHFPGAASYLFLALSTYRGCCASARTAAVVVVPRLLADLRDRS